MIGKRNKKPNLIGKSVRITPWFVPDAKDVDNVLFFLNFSCIYQKLLIQIQISLSIGNLYLADKVTHVVNKFIQKKIALRNTSPYTVKLDVTIILST